MEPPQAQPTQAACHPSRAQGFDAGGALVGLGDGNCRAEAPGISQATRWAACTPRGGEVLPVDWNE
jgi:hypothetical protein